TGRLSVGLPGHNVTEPVFSVPVQTLDVLGEHRVIERLALVKIDAEGAEGRILSGAQRLTERARPSFVIELHTPEQDVAVARWLTERGYRFERVTGPPIRHPECGWPDPDGVWGTIIARPR